jgi:hypothetical protein
MPKIIMLRDFAFIHAITFLPCFALFFLVVITHA